MPMATPSNRNIAVTVPRLKIEALYVKIKSRAQVLESLISGNMIKTLTLWRYGRMCRFNSSDISEEACRVVVNAETNYPACIELNSLPRPYDSIFFR